MQLLGSGVEIMRFSGLDIDFLTHFPQEQARKPRPAGLRPLPARTYRGDTEFEADAPEKTKIQRESAHEVSMISVERPY